MGDGDLSPAPPGGPAPPHACPSPRCGGGKCGASASPRAALRPPSAPHHQGFTCGICLADEVAEAGILDCCDHRCVNWRRSALAPAPPHSCALLASIFFFNLLSVSLLFISVSATPASRAGRPSSRGAPFVRPGSACCPGCGWMRPALLFLRGAPSGRALRRARPRRRRPPRLLPTAGPAASPARRASCWAWRRCRSGTR